MNIYLIRHGQKSEDEKNHELLGLNKEGNKQAVLVGKRLGNYDIEKIYTSNMVRAIETAEEINKYTNVEIETVPELRKIRMGACDKEGWTFLEKNYPEFIEEFNKHESDICYPPDGECGEDVWKRAIKVINEIVKSGLDSVVVVTHGGVIRALICGILGLNQSRRFYLGAPPENCSISLLKYDSNKNEFYVHSFNDYAHLEIF